MGAELAVTYLNEKARKFVEPLAEELEAKIVMPLDVCKPGELEAVFDRIAKEWGTLDFVVHSIAYSPKETLCGRVIDVPREGFLQTMDISVWSFIRMAHLAEPLMPKGGALFTMTYYGSQMVVEHYNIMGVAKAALESAVRYIASEVGPEGHSRSRHFARSACDARRFRHPRIRRASSQSPGESADTLPCQRHGRGACHGISRP